jgi:hypothetical protein
MKMAIGLRSSGARKYFTCLSISVDAGFDMPEPQRLFSGM